jgi:hypothetical protein
MKLIEIAARSSGNEAMDCTLSLWTARRWRE